MNSKRQQEASDQLDYLFLLYIETYNTIHGEGPTFHEIREQFEYKSLAAVRNRLNRLKREGRVDWEHGVNRSLHATTQERS